MGANCIDWWRPDSGITIATGVSAWVGQVNGHTFSNPTGASQPALAATGPGSTASIVFDSVDDFLDGPLLARAGNQTIWAVLRQLVPWTASDSLINDASATLIILQRTATPQLAMSRGTPGNNNGGIVMGTFGRVQAEFTGSVADTLRVAATVITGANVGTTAGTRPLLGRNGAATTFGGYELCDLALFDTIPSAGQRSSLDAYVTARYGGGLV
jgi:hypothetical protein